MEDLQTNAEPQHFENIDFNSSPEDNKESSNNDDHDQVLATFLLIFCTKLIIFWLISPHLFSSDEIIYVHKIIIHLAWFSLPLHMIKTKAISHS